MKRLKFAAIFLLIFFVLSNLISYLINPKPLWTYKTWRPFLAGWSEASNPIIDTDRVYVCMGYGWRENKVAVIALDKKTGREIWKNIIKYPCQSFSEEGHYVVAGVKQYTLDKEKQKSGPGQGIVWHHYAVIIDKNNGQILKKIDGEAKQYSQLVSKDFICDYRKGEVGSRMAYRLVCLNQQKNNVVFEENVSSASATLLNNILYFWPGGKSEYTYKVDLNNPKKEPLPFQLRSPIIRSYDNVLLSAEAHELRVISTNSEKILLKVHAQGWIKGIKLDGRLLFMADDSGTLTAVELPTSD